MKRKRWSWKRLWCWLDDHGGIYIDYENGHWCKRCGAKVKLL